MKFWNKIVATIFVSSVVSSAAYYTSIAQAQEEQDANVVYLANMKPISINQKALQNDWREEWKSVDAHLGGKVVPNSVFVPRQGGYPTGPNSIVLFLGSDFDYLDAYIGVSDFCPNAEETTRFYVRGDNKVIYTSDVMRAGDRPIYIHIPVKKVVRLELLTDKGPNGGDRIWGDAKLIKGDAAPESQPNVPGKAPEATGSKVLRIEPSVLRELATDFKAQLLDDPDLSKLKPTLAVAAFTLIPPKQLSPSNADNVREDLSTALIKTKAFEIVERGQLEQALKELKIGLSDTFDSATAQKLGKLVSARLVLIGSISDRGTYAVINARLIDTQTGKVPFASSVEARQ